MVNNELLKWVIFSSVVSENNIFVEYIIFHT